jgi:hypothetical protein
MGKDQSQIIRYLHEVASSINLAFALTAFFFLLGPEPATSALFLMNLAIYRRLNLLPDIRVPKDSYNEGYFAFFVPAVALAVCLWLFLRLFARTRLTRDFLRFVAGIAGFVAASVWWLCSTFASSHRYGWSPFATIQFYEVVLVLVFAILYLSTNWPNAERAGIAILVLHYGFWFWQFGSYPFFMGYGGPIAPATGLCAGLTWVFYLRQPRLRSAN